MNVGSSPQGIPSSRAMDRYANLVIRIEKRRYSKHWEYGSFGQGGWEWNSFPATPRRSITVVTEVSKWDVKREGPR